MEGQEMNPTNIAMERTSNRGAKGLNMNIPNHVASSSQEVKEAMEMMRTTRTKIWVLKEVKVMLFKEFTRKNAF
ncbi:hypothetical protein H5410_062683 [Solanum commersonii]|uniref:Uncharacterized protein n=1 Tax=Solanum commersonii TaxID=4109 RepID=A0A9J5WBK7_SOLCO|nr:hypothetical protein H5410_062683 [Solanum commersonii]